jgi:hypothetical protein
MTASKFSGPLLKRMLYVEGGLKLPKHIILKDNTRHWEILPICLPRFRNGFRTDLEM